ncbi:MAG: alanine--tRNA ligase [Candidatus Aminicenantes bacterium]|nr:alanine--tRNA ligase [Candidatus Aminicenantes bacterium]
MNAQDIRKKFLDYFESKNHKIVTSSSLLPKDDPTLLFTNAGMNQFKNVFLGLEKRSYQRAASVQKCMRVSGKHNDLEQVGKTTKHHTFFEMLGNFSFGDYFKKQAIEYAWELITDVYQIDPDKLYATVYKKDQEAYQIWRQDIGLSKDKIFYMGEEENYWSMGDTGPCGPCSEIHYQMVKNLSHKDPKYLIESGSEDFTELWNLVFMQYNRDENGNLSELPAPSIDTGMGLERMATVLQNKKDNYENDLFDPIIKKVVTLSGREITPKTFQSLSVRKIADHIRAIVFLINDGIMPSNEGRGYVLRRIIRRAFRAGKQMGFEGAFLFKLVGVVCDSMREAYPELISSANYISKVCQSEEERFSKTLSTGMKTFDHMVKELRQKKQKIFPGEKLFKLYDTYGFPLDLSKELAEDEKMEIDEQGFEEELLKQRQTARKSWKGDLEQKKRKKYQKYKDLKIDYVGYEKESISDSQVLVLLKKGAEVNELKKGEKGEIFLDTTPFYAEAGGQISDKGIIKHSGFSAEVQAAVYPIPNIISHKVKILSGAVKVGDQVEAEVDIKRRKAISKNHTATHLLHAALRDRIGSHVKQSGSLVSPEKLRFDFTHFSSLSFAEIKSVEQLVNEKIQECIPVSVRMTSLDKGIKEGAVAIFEEKYSEEVRVITIGDFSKELCGGVHVQNTGEIGFFKIISESSVAAGMRRIEAVTSDSALKYTQKNEEVLAEIEESLNVSKDKAADQIQRLKETVKQKDKECQSLKQKMINLREEQKQEEKYDINGFSVLIKKMEGLSGSELRNLADDLKQKSGSDIIILSTVSENKVSMVTTVHKSLTDRVKAKDIINEMAPVIGGGGGGRPDFAQAGGTKPDQIKQAVKKGLAYIKSILNP